jgi:formylglycine-generating enzyme required for sulfatase activity
MAKIFINYRRDDSAGYAGRLYDRLVSHFGRDHVFMDIDQIEPGEEFDKVIQEKLKAVQVAVVLIGAHWLDIAGANGQRRLDDPDDWVRLEIAALLERDIRVIPVLVGGATLPKSTQLPECLAPLTRRQAFEITDHRFHADADKLIKALGRRVLPRFVGITGIIGIVLATGMYFGEIAPKPVSIQPAVPVPTIQPVVETPKTAIIEPEMVRVPPGKFLMGSNVSDLDEQPVHEVTISYAFEIGKYELTFDEYDVFAKATRRRLPNDYGWGRGNRPVIDVTWHDAQAYAKWLSDETGKKYRIPTEAEWEYAARAGTQTGYWWGNDVGKNNANCGNCGSQWDGKQTALAGSFKANTFGLHEISGNVWEWTQDCWHRNYENAPTDGSAWLEKDGGYCRHRVIRGGSWNNIPRSLLSTFREWGSTVLSDDDMGFRIARDF